MLQAFFDVVNDQDKQWEVNSESETLKEKVRELNKVHPECIISNYARVLLEKFKRLSGCEIDDPYQKQEPSHFQNFKIDPDVIQYEEVLFVRILFEFSFIMKKELSFEFLNSIEEITPGIEEYQTIFDFFLNLDTDPRSGSN